MGRRWRWYKKRGLEYAARQSGRLLSELALRWELPLSFPFVLTDRYGTLFMRYPWDGRDLGAEREHAHFELEFKAYARLCRDAKTVLDIGANAGLVSVFLARQIPVAAMVHAFEPSPDTYWRLLETLALNKAQNVTPHRMAMSDSPGALQFFEYGDLCSEFNSAVAHPMSGPHGIVHPVREISVPCTTVDGFLDENGIQSVDLLKIDVEGLEPEVIRGAQRCLRERRVAAVGFEVSVEPMKGAGHSAANLIAELGQFGYAVYRFRNDTGGFEGPVSDVDATWEICFGFPEGTAPNIRYPETIGCGPPQG